MKGSVRVSVGVLKYASTFDFLKCGILRVDLQKMAFKILLPLVLPEFCSINSHGRKLPTFIEA